MNETKTHWTKRVAHVLGRMVDWAMVAMMALTIAGVFYEGFTSVPDCTCFRENGDQWLHLRLLFWPELWPSLSNWKAPEWLYFSAPVAPLALLLWRYCALDTVRRFRVAYAFLLTSGGYLLLFKLLIRAYLGFTHTWLLAFHTTMVLYLLLGAIPLLRKTPLRASPITWFLWWCAILGYELFVRL